MAQGSSGAPVRAGVELLPEDDAVPAEMAAWLTAAPVVLAGVTAAHEWDARTRVAVLAAFDRVVNTLTVAKARVVTAEREQGTWGLKGDRDLAGFVGRVSHEGRGAGLVAVGQAATLEAMPQVAEALVAGPVTPRHVTEIARATAKSPVLATRLATPEGQAEVVELARRLDGSRFGTALQQLSASLDPASRQREHDEQRANRYLLLTHTSGGTLIKGQLDNVAGHELAKAIDALNPRPAKDDERPRQVRQADALMVMVHRILSDKDTTPDAVAPVQALITFSQETWAALRAARQNVNGADKAGGTGTGEGADKADYAGGGAGAAGPVREPGAGSAADVLTSLRGVPAVTDETGQAWPASEIARALCDCTLTRVVLDAKDQPLNLGRQERLFTKAQWLALYASGTTTCAVDGCSMPIRYAELHHMRWWREQGGRTDYTNLAPECTFHHHETHRLGLTVTRRPDGTYEHRHPDGRLYGRTPPGDTDSSPPGVLPLYDTA